MIPLLAVAKARVVATATRADADLLGDLGAQETHRIQRIRVPVRRRRGIQPHPGDHLIGLALAIRSGGRLLTITTPSRNRNGSAATTSACDSYWTWTASRRNARGRRPRIRCQLPATIGRRYMLDQGVQACVDFARRHTTRQTRRDDMTDDLSAFEARSSADPQLGWDRHAGDPNP